jgi:hypothetical protein
LPLRLEDTKENTFIDETFEKYSFMFKFKEDENFDHPSTICRTYGAGRNTLITSKIKI